MSKLKDVLGFINNDVRIINANGEEIVLAYQLKKKIRKIQISKLKDVLGFINNDVRIINANGEEIVLVSQGFQDAISDKYLECSVLELSINEAMDVTIDVMIAMSEE